MIVLDTDVLSIIQDVVEPAYGRLVGRLDASGESPIITIVSVEEQMRGWLKYCAGAKTPDQYIGATDQLREWLDHLTDYPIFPFDAAAATQFKKLKAAKVRIGTMDLRIAAIVLAHDGLLISSNLKDFRKVPNLHVEDWTR